MKPPGDDLLVTKYRSTTISTPPSTPKDTAGGEITDLPPPQNATPLPAGTVPPSERPNTPTHPISLSYEIGDEFVCAPVPAPEADPASHLPKHLMPSFHFSFSTIEFLEKQNNRDLDDNIAVVCQKFQLERDLKDRALSQATALKARCATLENDIVGFASSIRKSGSVLEEAVRRDFEIRAKLEKSRETVESQNQEIQKYRRDLGKSRRGQAETERKRLDEASLLNEKLATVEQELLVAQAALKKAETQAHILADMEFRLKRQRRIYFLAYLFLLLLFVFVLLGGGGVLGIPQLHKRLQHLHFRKILPLRGAPNPTTQYLG
ncbi:hypothetical protein TWF106_006436 [Orbilia oligospora]|uniref:Uncharacterized protein n=1 Tax=Orbilia oligospora TaxID=2813651 RepID=A0A7C8QRB3_ORBOL|nr:hypothetical protein TWF106_006436 [Orbilia oligospora]